MAARNFRGDGQQKTIKYLFCSPDLSAGLHGHLTFLSVINSFLSITAFLGNALILNALRTESSLHPPSKLLLRSLSTTDLCVGLIAEPLAVNVLMSVVKENWSICRYAFVTSRVTGYTLCGVSVGTLTAISVDRLLALMLGLRYRQVVTLKRTYVIVFTLWLLPAVFSAMYFWNPLITTLYGITYIPLCLAVSFFSYTDFHHPPPSSKSSTRPCSTTKPNKSTERRAIQNGSVHCNMAKLTVVACFLPYGIVEVLRAKSGLSSSLYHAWSCSATLVFLNSSLNPILYCWKLDQVRQAVKDTIRQVPCLCFSG